MGTKIRVFIASTMKDLRNERRQVVTRVRQLNFEPVNAEGWPPTGARAWDRIEKELASCHLFVLVLGESYGWVPEEGPGAGGGLSVTHMEARRARELGLPILPFLKRLEYGAPPDPRRDAFRAEVSDWAAGGVVAEFEYADELTDEVAASLVEVLSDTYLSTAVQERSKSVRELEPEPEAGAGGNEAVDIPRELTRLVAERRVVLLAGAGISLAAGYPSMRAMNETVTAHLRRELNAPSLSLTGMPFQEIASNIEAAYGRQYLLDIFLRAMSGPQGIEPTEAHLISVRLFPKIATTNFDTLFEAACRAQGIRYVVNETPLTASADTDIYKLSGSLDQPQSLLITEKDVWESFQHGEPYGLYLGALLRSLRVALADSPVLVVGSSLRDTAVKMLFSENVLFPRGHVSLDAVRGYLVSPFINQFERLQYERLNLQPVVATADAFFRQLSLEAGPPRPEGTRES